MFSRTYRAVTAWNWISFSPAIVPFSHVDGLRGVGRRGDEEHSQQK
jgi:hypothetical protein